MKKGSLNIQFIVILAICFIGNISCSQAQQFEGIIHFKTSGGPNSKMVNMQYMIKNNEIRYQFGEGNKSGAMLLLPDESKMIILIKKMHGYMEMDMNEMNDESYKGKWSGSKMVKTGKHKKIAGHSCEVWTVTRDQQNKLTLCMAKGFGSFISPANPMIRKNAPDWTKEITTGSGYMPLEVTQTDDGKEITQMKATRIEKKPLDKSLFKIPDSYKDMSAMMKQMQKLRNKTQH